MILSLVGFSAHFIASEGSRCLMGGSDVVNPFFLLVGLGDSLHFVVGSHRWVWDNGDSFLVGYIAGWWTWDVHMSL